MKQSTGRRGWIGFDLGGTKMLSSVFDSAFRRLASCRKKTRPKDGGSPLIDRMLRVIGEALAASKIPLSRIGGIGVGVPGPVNLNEGTIIEAPNLGIRNLPLRKKLSDALGIPVRVVNDVDAGAYGEYRFGAGKGARCLLAVFPGTGIGAGCILHGRLVRGKSLSGMELGHMKIQEGGPVCGCGRQGCLEAVAGRLAISAEAAAAAYRGEAPALKKLAGTDLAAIRSKALAQAIREGDASIERVVARAAYRLGVGIANVINLIGPDLVLLGGGLVGEMPALFLRHCRAAAEAYAMASFRGSFRIETARLGDSAVILGAAALAAEPEAIGS